jgi:hypothetical protein
MKRIGIALMALMALAACETKTASLQTQQTAAIQWDDLVAADQVAYAPRNSNLIFMR